MAKKERSAKTFFEKRSFVLVVASVTFVCFATILMVVLVRQYREKQEELESITQHLSQVYDENEKIQHDIDNGISDEEAEQNAREEGYIFPGENVYQEAS
ncbi:MAG: hypothetical protein E7536_10620 [Ruminococcaceae bacterium]|nr:hypothetical protein [Oscillospiraceae bacterium]